MTDSRPTYTEVDDRLRATHIGMSTSELHGLATGLLLTGADRAERLSEEILRDLQLSDTETAESVAIIHRIFEHTADELSDSAFRYNPLLPPDSAALPERAEALRDWCGGFLYGMGLLGASVSNLSPEAAEALQDVAEISRLDVAAIGSTEEEEQDFSELVEFLRMAALMIREELAARDGGNA